MNVFVTGGAGFIGSHVTNKILDAGHEVTVYDDLSKGYQEYVDPRAKFVKEDLEDFEKLRKSILGHDAVIHLAAESIIKDSIDDPKTHLQKNINNAINLLEAMRLAGIDKIIFSSSAAVYGETGEKPVSEDVLKSPLQPYGSSKLAIEVILSAYHHSFGINSTSLRYFNVYGPRDDQLPVTRAVPNWFKSTLTNRPVTLYWDGKQLRDYIFVKDVASVHLLALENCTGLNYYNIGSGTGHTMREILESVFKAAGKTVPITDGGERPGDPNRLVADTRKIGKELGWQPKYSLEQGMAETYDFYRTHSESLSRI